MVSFVVVVIRVTVHIMSLTHSGLLYSSVRMGSAAANGVIAALEMPGVAAAVRVVHAGEFKLV